VARLVLVGCGPLEARDAGEVTRTRLAALEEPERTELRGLLEGAGAPGFGGAALARLGALLRRTDFCDPCEPGETDGDDPSADPADAVEFRPDLHRSVWAEAAALRASGRLAAACARVACPILVLHGDRDPHPVRCVVEPLAARGCAVHPEILARCGHTPWLEREGREPFFAALERELAGCR
jgi:pimeloyl-ACP methyl ester carboxylesterase